MEWANGQGEYDREGAGFIRGIPRVACKQRGKGCLRRAKIQWKNSRGKTGATHKIKGLPSKSETGMQTIEGIELEGGGCAVCGIVIGER